MKHTGKIIVAGHVCLDITPVFSGGTSLSGLDELLVPGKLINVASANVHTGGCVANTGLALKALGNDVTLMGKIGDDFFGKIIQQSFAQYHAGGLIVDEASATSYSVVLAVPGVDRIFLHCPGANDTFTGKDIPDGALADAALFHFGYPPLMRTMFENGGKELASLLSSMKARGIATSLDFAAIDPASEAGKVDWTALLANVLPYTDFFVPSFEELCFMLDRENYDRLKLYGGDMIGHLDVDRDVKPLAEKALALGCSAILIKCGTAGMYFRTGSMARVSPRLPLNRNEWAEQEVFQPCFKAEILRSATGAGDASIAAFLSAVLCGKKPAECTALAAAEGACAVTAYDALSGLLSLEELEKKIAAGWPHQ